MQLPPATEQKWQDIILGRTKYEFEFLAAKIFLARAFTAVARDSSPSHVAYLAGELRDLFVKNCQLSTAQKDIKKIFG